MSDQKYIVKILELNGQLLCFNLVNLHSNEDRSVDILMKLIKFD